ncbi:UNVERIFIED_CONTAM: hypothetical protein PYX00_004845 [Menopon gallinae]|uniref:ZP domain-containing protein n=1 Tax=Menopon gallinae TaxID=328185 RepID=A0AAW2I6W5_9NEOP
MTNLPFCLLIVFVIGMFRPINGDVEILSPKQEIEKIRELARMIRQTDNPSELTVQNLLMWLQGKYDAQVNGNRRTRQQQPSREYLPAKDDNLGVSRPRPFQRPQPTLSTPSQRPYPQPVDQPGYEPYPNPGTTPKPQFNYPEQPTYTQRPTFGESYPDQGSQNLPTSRPRPTSTELNYFQGSTSQPSGTGFEYEQEGNKQNEIGGVAGDDEAHPPHIHDINVQCAKDMMTITIEFNRVFNGVIYSKGFYNYEKCRYVNENSGQTKYTFTVSLDSCGTQFVDQFAQGGQAYLENTLVLQNEAGIQEVWDTVRMVRCLWEGSIKQDLSVSLVIGMLAQEVVTFSGDTGRARLDIQVGRGPFAPAANGLVKIGEIMTLVVYVEGDPGFDVVVRQCQARDSAGTNSIQLFDERGCVLKPKLFGAFQKTRETGNTGASVIAYAFFSAFKFPDEMDLLIECNVELCKTDCEMCPDPQKFEPGKRRRRDVGFNETLGDFGSRVSGRFRVVSEDDISDLAIREHYIQLTGKHDGICMSTQGFLFSSLLILALLLSSSVTTAVLWLKLQKTPSSKI